MFFVSDMTRITHPHTQKGNHVMKKIITLLLAVSILLTLALSMTSCSTAARLSRMEESERAYYFYAVIDRNMGYAYSGTYDQKMTLDTTISGVAYKQTTEATVTFESSYKGLTLLETSKTTVDTVGGGTVIYTDTGYVDGMMFSHTKEGGNETKLKSPVALEDYSAYNQYRNEKAPEIDVSTDSAKTVTCQMNEDKTWTATYEGFTAQGLVPFLHMLRGIDYYLTAEHEITDVRMTIHADADLYPTDMKIEFIFSAKPDATSKTPVVTLENTYRGWNSTTPEAYDISDFTEVDDLRAVDVFLDAILEKEYEKSGNVDMTVTSTTHGGGYNGTDTSKQYLTFNHTDGFTFDLSYEAEGYEYKMGYADGNFRVRVYDAKTDRLVDNTSEPMTEADARATVSQLMDPEGFTYRSFSGVEIVDAEAGICRFALSDAVKSVYKSEYEAMGLSLKEFSGYCEATLKDGVLTDYRIHVEMNLRMPGESIQIIVDMAFAFTTSVNSGAETV